MKELATHKVITEIAQTIGTVSTNLKLTEDEPELVMSFHERPEGPKHPLVEVIRPGDPMFDRLMNYRYYRLQTRGKDKQESLLYLHRYQKPLDNAMKDCKFDGSDPIMVLKFLTRYVEETDKLGMTEAQESQRATQVKMEMSYQKGRSH